MARNLSESPKKVCINRASMPFFDHSVIIFLGCFPCECAACVLSVCASSVINFLFCFCFCSRMLFVHLFPCVQESPLYSLLLHLYIFVSLSIKLFSMLFIYWSSPLIFSKTTHHHRFSISGHPSDERRMFGFFFMQRIQLLGGLRDLYVGGKNMSSIEHVKLD